MKNYEKHGITGIELPAYLDGNGRPFWVGQLTPVADKRRCIVPVPPNLPGIILFVHGVNSEGEWYKKAEAGLVAGLNQRLGLAPHGDAVKLKEHTFEKKESRPQQNPALRSPVIHFHWGYRDPAKKDEKPKYRVPLMDKAQKSAWNKNADAHPPFYWGGGPFQNGTNNLPLLWAEQGFRRRSWLGFIPINVQRLNPEEDRQLQDAPSRTYYAHAAQRLAKLIDKIRDRYNNDTITVVSHSQGTMVAMAAIFLMKQRVPDSLILMNSPYALEHKITDTLQQGDATATDRARMDTFANVVQKMQQGARKLDERLLKGLRVGTSEDGKTRWRPDQVGKESDLPLKSIPYKERDNHGRVYVYFNPHDRVMGSTALQSIGWQGLPEVLLKRFPGTLYQRMLARQTACGDTPGLQPFAPQDGKPFWDPNRNAKGIPVKIWTKPKSDQKVFINAERVPQPLTIKDMAEFDEAKSGVKWSDEKVFPEYKYFRDIHQAEEWKERGEDAEGLPIREIETPAEMEQRIANYVPEPTDHSSLPMHLKFMSQVVAYDIPIGPCESFKDAAFWQELKHDADWLESDPYYANGTLEVPPLPEGIITETIEDIRRIEEAQAKLNQQQTNTLAAGTNTTRPGPPTA